MKMKISPEWLKNKIETEPDMYDGVSESALSDLLNNGKPTIEGYFWFKSENGQFAEWEVVLVTKQNTGRLFMNRICSMRGYAIDEIEQHFKRCKFGLKVTEPVI